MKISSINPVIYFPKSEFQSVVDQSEFQKSPLNDQTEIKLLLFLLFQQFLTPCLTGQKDNLMNSQGASLSAHHFADFRWQSPGKSPPKEDIAFILEKKNHQILKTKLILVSVLCNNCSSMCPVAQLFFRGGERGNAVTRIQMKKKITTTKIKAHCVIHSTRTRCHMLWI